jgi:hypothetical protein
VLKLSGELSHCLLVWTCLQIRYEREREVYRAGGQQQRQQQQQQQQQRHVPAGGTTSAAAQPAANPLWAQLGPSRPSSLPVSALRPVQPQAPASASPLNLQRPAAQGTSSSLASAAADGGGSGGSGGSGGHYATCEHGRDGSGPSSSPGAGRTAGTTAGPTHPAEDGCIVCMDAPKQAVLLPCRHHALCLTCTQRIFKEPAGQQRRCPYCRAQVGERAP